MNTKTIRHFFAFQTHRGGAFWMNNDGSTNECGELHRFSDRKQRDAWVADAEWASGQVLIRNNNERRAVTARSLPHGWKVYGPNHDEYLDHNEAGECEWMPPGWVNV